jgi:hypothetical protein
MGLGYVIRRFLGRAQAQDSAPGLGNQYFAAAPRGSSRIRGCPDQSCFQVRVGQCDLGKLPTLL